MFDLLSTLPESLSAVQQGSALQVVEDETGVNVKGLSSHPAHTEEEALNLLFEASVESVNFHPSCTSDIQRKKKACVQDFTPQRIVSLYRRVRRIERSLNTR